MINFFPTQSSQVSNFNTNNIISGNSVTVTNPFIPVEDTLGLSPEARKYLSGQEKLLVSDEESFQGLANQGLGSHTSRKDAEKAVKGDDNALRSLLLSDLQAHQAGSSVNALQDIQDQLLAAKKADRRNPQASINDLQRLSGQVGRLAASQPPAPVVQPSHPVQPTHGGKHLMGMSGGQHTLHMHLNAKHG